MICKGLIQSRVIVLYSFALVFGSSFIVNIFAWVPDMHSKFEISHENIKSDIFYGNGTDANYFKLLDSTDNYILLGGRNFMYNVSTDDLTENFDQRLEWTSTDAQAGWCCVRGKKKSECQNYFRVFKRINDKLFICGTNSGRPLCREYSFNETTNKYSPGSDSDGIGLGPYNPDDNTTAVYYHGQLYTATVPEFSGGDALIYRKPQRTERADYKSLNAPNFVNSFGYGDYVFFFYRETAVEFMNCGKAIYSRVSRVCKDDKGGPHQFRDRWTTFLKARLNCSIPGDYPFYFDEIQATSEVIRGQYGTNYTLDELIYGVMTTPMNAIGGSAICAYSMRDILSVFDGSFKGQEDINANWLAVPNEKVPTPRPGQCVTDSRTLSDDVVYFVKTHPLMDQAVPAYFTRPILVHVSLQYRFTTIAVDPQVLSLDGTPYDVLYIGTDDGKLIKAIYTNVENRNNSVNTVVISKNQVLPRGSPITGLKVIRAKHKIVIVSKTQVRTVQLSYCTNIPSCSECVRPQDPHCAWDLSQSRCVQINVETVLNVDNYIQSIADGDTEKCRAAKPRSQGSQETNSIHQKGILSAIGGQEPDLKKIEDQLTFNVLVDNNIPTIEAEPPAPASNLMIQKAETFQLLLISLCFVALIIGFVAGFLFSRRFPPVAGLVDTSVTEQHNHLNRPLISRFTSPHLNSSANRSSSFLPPRVNKASNLACNLPTNKNLIKKDNNLDANKELNNSIESIDKNTLQKVKKTYI